MFWEEAPFSPGVRKDCPKSNCSARRLRLLYKWDQWVPTLSGIPSRHLLKKQKLVQHFKSRSKTIFINILPAEFPLVALSLSMGKKIGSFYDFMQYHEANIPRGRGRRRLSPIQHSGTAGGSKAACKEESCHPSEPPGICLGATERSPVGSSGWRRSFLRRNTCDWLGSCNRDQSVFWLHTTDLNGKWIGQILRTLHYKTLMIKNNQA